MAEPPGQTARFFKTAWFAKAARKAHIDDTELCAAIQQVLLGQADDLGGGVYKKTPQQEPVQKHHRRARWQILDVYLSLR